MVLSSAIFIFLFFPVVLLLYYFLFWFFQKNKDKKFLRLSNLLLLVFSIIFYSFGEPTLLWVMLTSTVVDYVAGLALGYSGKINRGEIEALPVGDKRSSYQKTLLVISLSMNLGFLFYFKYIYFFTSSLNEAMGYLSLSNLSLPLLSPLLPVGISFYTFQSMSYTIDVYRGYVKANKSFIDFALFVTFFPQLVAGPIVRYTEIEKELSWRQIRLADMVEGIHRFVYGLAKKILIADTVGKAADVIFALPNSDLTFALAWMGAIYYTFQIYFDFSGYSDMAIGIARMTGFRFPENFDQPYRSKSITEFWRRWHMTLSHWFRDYLYIPLGGNRKGGMRTYINLGAVFLFCGVWHGASWNFVIWGLYHGGLLIIERLLLTRYNFSPKGYWGMLITFMLTIIGWVFFRSDTLTQSFGFLSKMIYFDTDLVKTASDFTFAFYNRAPVMLALLFAIGFSFIPSAWMESNILKYKKTQSMTTLIIFLLSIAFMVGSDFNPFIYFRF